MGIGLSPLGGGHAGSNGLGVVEAQDKEEVRKKKMEDILGIVGTRWGRVSRDGLKRAAERVGLECLWEEGREGRGTLSIAKLGVLIDVEFSFEEVVGVTLEYLTSGSEVGKSAAAGAEVLKKNLTTHEDIGPIMLDAFVDNLERLVSWFRSIFPLSAARN